MLLQDDESLRRWKEKLLGCVEGELNGWPLRMPFVAIHWISFLCLIIFGFVLHFFVRPSGT